eukprot:Opistho-2@55254
MADQTVLSDEFINVFVGNLPFKVTEDDLVTLFKQNTQNVAGAKIIRRGPRSLGYGFVQFTEDNSAKDAVTKWNKKDYEGRELNVEIAKPREEGAPRERAEGSNARGRGRGRGRGISGAPRGGAVYAEGSAPAPRGGRAPRGGAAAAGAPAGAAPAARGGARGGRGARAPRPPREEGSAPAQTKISSATALFVANLPFTVDDERLKSEVFEGFNVKTAHVVLKRNNRSKGFGFVEFETAEEQHRALAAVDKKSVEGRELAVKIALQGDKVEGEAAQQ